MGILLNRTIQMAYKHMKRMLTLLVISEMKTTASKYYKTTNMANIKKTDDTKLLANMWGMAIIIDC